MRENEISATGKSALGEARSSCELWRSTGMSDHQSWMVVSTQLSKQQERRVQGPLSPSTEPSPQLGRVPAHLLAHDIAGFVGFRGPMYGIEVSM